MTVIPGKLFFHSETGTEGGRYAMQKSESIQYVKSLYGIFEGRIVYDPEDIVRSGRVVASKKIDGTVFNESAPGDVSYLDIEWDDSTMESGRSSEHVLVEQWDRDGMVLLKTGDRLTVCERGVGSVAVWAGVLVLQEQDPYADGSYAPFGLASHHRPVVDGINSDDWTSLFLKEYWATHER